MHRLQLGEAPQLEKVNQSGEFKRGTIGEAQETYRIETFGKVIGITRQVLINDDLDAFTRVPALFGTSAATLESDVVWGIFTANPAMADGPRSSTPTTRTSRAPARRSTSPASPRRAPPWRSSAGSTARRS